MIFDKIKNFFNHIAEESNGKWREYVKGISESLKPCPICGRKAALVEMIDIGGNYSTWWHVECEDFDDHGAWTLPIRCNFNGAGYLGDGFYRSYCPGDAARLWNEVVVPTAIRTKEAMERVRKYDDEHQGNDGYLLVNDGAYAIGKFNEKKPVNNGIIYCNYVPKMISHEEMEERERKFRAGKTYAKVKLAHPNPSYRGKRGIIWETNFLNGEEQCLLEIETLNTTSENGFTTWIGVLYPTGYTKIWFPKSVLEDFETYDENGDIILT